MTIVLLNRALTHFYRLSKVSMSITPVSGFAAIFYVKFLLVCLYLLSACAESQYLSELIVAFDSSVKIVRMKL